MNTSETLMFWNPDKRGCFFEKERRLMHFNKYNQKNCDIECEANRTLQMCKCSPIYHPSKIFRCMLYEKRLRTLKCFVLLYLSYAFGVLVS